MRVRVCVRDGTGRPDLLVHHVQRIHVVAVVHAPAAVAAGPVVLEIAFPGLWFVFVLPQPIKSYSFFESQYYKQNIPIAREGRACVGWVLVEGYRSGIWQVRCSEVSGVVSGRGEESDTGVGMADTDTDICYRGNAEVAR